MFPIQTKIRIVVLAGYLFPLVANSTLSPNLLYPQGQQLYDKYPHTLMYYYGVTVSDPLARIYRMNRWPEHVQSLEYSYTLNERNVVRRLFSPIVGVVQLAANVTQRVGSKQSDIYEFNPYICFRWANLPWNHYVSTSFAIGEGISYASSYPSLEKKDNENTKRLLNYLMFEASFASPYNPRLQVIARIHHRSGAYGVYHAGNTGSNVIGVGVRYLFD